MVENVDKSLSIQRLIESNKRELNEKKELNAPQTLYFIIKQLKVLYISSYSMFDIYTSINYDNHCNVNTTISPLICNCNQSINYNESYYNSDCNKTPSNIHSNIPYNNGYTQNI